MARGGLVVPLHPAAAVVVRLAAGGGVLFPTERDVGRGRGRDGRVPEVFHLSLEAGFGPPPSEFGVVGLDVARVSSGGSGSEPVVSDEAVEV